MPNNIDAAVQWTNKYTYFFNDGKYYRFDDKRFEIDRGDPPFPRPSGRWWFGCESADIKGESGSSLIQYGEDNEYDDDEDDYGGATIFTRFLQKKDKVINFFSKFDEAGETLLDALAGDE